MWVSYMAPEKQGAGRGAESSEGWGCRNKWHSERVLSLGQPQCKGQKIQEERRPAPVFHEL